jgi:general secretion pathway protein K
MCRRHERGMALLGAVTALAGLVIVATALAHTATRSQQRTGAALATLQADALVRSAVATASVLLGEHDLVADTDTLRSPWAMPLGPQALGAGRVEAVVEDEARRLDLTRPEGLEALPRLLAALELDPALADALADWTDADDAPHARGAERAWYVGRRPSIVPANAPPRTIGELAAVRGMTPRALARLRPYVGTAGERGVNPNTAPREVLAAWIGDDARAQALVAARETAVVPCTDLPGCTPRSRHYTLRITATVRPVRRTVEATLGVIGGRAEVMAWRVVD